MLGVVAVCLFLGIFFASGSVVSASSVEGSDEGGDLSVAAYGPVTGKIVKNYPDEFDLKIQISSWNGSEFDSNVDQFLKADVIFVRGDATFSTDTARKIEDAVYSKGKVLVVGFWSDGEFSDSLPAEKIGMEPYGSKVEVVEKDHPVTRDLPNTFGIGKSKWSDFNRRKVSPKQGSTVITEYSNDGSPAMVIGEYGQGYVIYNTMELAHCFYGDYLPRLMKQAVKFAADKLGGKITKADVVENYYQSVHLSIDEIYNKVEKHTKVLKDTALEMLEPDPLEIVGVSTEWADITKATASSFDILKSATAHESLAEMNLETTMPVKSEFSEDYGDPKGLVGTLKEWSNLLSDGRRNQAKSYAVWDVNVRLFKATEFYHSRLGWADVERYIKINRQIEKLLPKDLDWYYDDEDFDGLANYYEDDLGIDPKDNDTDDDGTIDSLDSTPDGSNSDLFSLWSPADLLVTNENGDRTGTVYENGVLKGTVNEIPGSVYSGPDSDHEFISIRNPSSDKYEISIQGTGEGTMGIEISLYSPNGRFTYSYSKIPTNQVSKAKLTLEKSKNQNTNYKPELSLDNDGDSLVERQISPDTKLISYKILLNEGWNLFSVPLDPENAEAGMVFDEFVEFPTIYGWDGGYSLIEEDVELELGEGYWVYVQESENVTVTGTPVENLTLSLSQGWNLAGLPSGVLPQTPGDIWPEVPTIYGWAADGYLPLDATGNFEPGQGYWIYSKQGENVTVS